MNRTDTQNLWLMAILREIPFTGWKDTAISAAAENLRRDPIEFERIFPHGIQDVIIYWHQWLDQEMVAELSRQLSTPNDANLLPNAATPPKKFGVSDKIRLAVKIRFELMAAHRLAARQAMSIIGAKSAKLLAQTVDEIWIAVGDTSSDFNWYSKRASLAAIFAATAFYWLDDESPGQNETWQFLDRRLADLAAFHRNKNIVQQKLRQNFQAIFGGIGGKKGGMTHLATKRVTCPILRPGTGSVLP